MEYIDIRTREGVDGLGGGDSGIIVLFYFKLNYMAWWETRLPELLRFIETYRWKLAADAAPRRWPGKQALWIAHYAENFNDFITMAEWMKWLAE